MCCIKSTKHFCNFYPNNTAQNSWTKSFSWDRTLEQAVWYKRKNTCFEQLNQNQDSKCFMNLLMAGSELAIGEL